MYRLIIKIKVKLLSLWRTNPKAAYLNALMTNKAGKKIILFTKLHPIYADFAYSKSLNGYRYIYFNPEWKNREYGRRILKLASVLHSDAATTSEALLEFEGKVIVECEAAARPEWLSDQRIDNLIFQSSYAANRNGWPNQKVVYPAINVSNNPKQTKRKTETIKLVTVGYGCLIKGYDVSFEIFQGLKAKGYPVELIIAGKSEHNFTLYPEATMDAFEAGGYNNIEDYAALFPDAQIRPYYREELFANIYPQAFLMLHFARMETFGYTVLEAMSFGVPVVSVKFKALPEMIEHGVNGYLCDPFDWDGVSALNESKMNDPAWRKCCVENGLHYVETLINDKQLYQAMRKASLQAVQKFSYQSRANAMEAMLSTAKKVKS